MCVPNIDTTLSPVRVQSAETFTQRDPDPGSAGVRMFGGFDDQGIMS